MSPQKATPAATDTKQTLLRRVKITSLLATLLGGLMTVAGRFWQEKTQKKTKASSLGLRSLNIVGWLFRFSKKRLLPIRVGLFVSNTVFVYIKKN